MHLLYFEIMIQTLFGARTESRSLLLYNLLHSRYYPTVDGQEEEEGQQQKEGINKLMMRMWNSIYAGLG